MKPEEFKGLYVPIMDTKPEVVLELSFDKTCEVQHAVKLALQLVALVYPDCGELSWGIFGDRIIVARQVTHMSLDIFNLPLN